MQTFVKNLTDFDQSLVLNGIKAGKKLAAHKAAKAALAGSLFLSASAISTGIIPVQIKLAGVEVTNIEKAEAGFVADAINAVGAKNLWYYFNGGRFRQYWFKSLDRNDTSWYNRQYGAGAQGALHTWCHTEAVRRFNLNWWERQMLAAGYKHFFIAARQSNGYTHCYVRVYKG